MKKILFLHGFFATGSCPMALALRDALRGQAIVLTPDLPLHPKEALAYIRILIDKENPDLLIGNSCGAFLAQILSPIVGIPALLGNPHFKMTDFLRERIGEHAYKAPRKDGNQKLTIDEALIHEFEELEAKQFDGCHPSDKDRVWGLFGDQDSLAHFEPTFLEHYNNSYHFPGGHTPTEQEVRTWYAPLAQKMLTVTSARNSHHPTMASRRIKEEKAVVEQMIRLYCRKHEGHTGLCPSCRELLDYAHSRLDRCRYGEDKPTCKKCPTHCYRPEMKERIRVVMRWAGPRMMLYHPLAAIRHLLREKHRRHE